MGFRVVSDKHGRLASSLGGKLRDLVVKFVTHIGNEIISSQVGINRDAPLQRLETIWRMLT